jgi:hypothetical protein
MFRAHSAAADAQLFNAEMISAAQLASSSALLECLEKHIILCSRDTMQQPNRVPLPLALKNRKKRFTEDGGPR